MGTIEPRGNDGGDEELRTVGVLSSVSHGEDTRLGVLELEVLIYKRIDEAMHGQELSSFSNPLTSELLAVNRLSASACRIAYNEPKLMLHVVVDCDAPLPRVKSPPCNMKPGMTRWNLEPA